jgi:hypothetical protein
MDLVNHPLVSGAAKRTGLSWFSISPLFLDPAEQAGVESSSRAPSHYLDHPEAILDSVWALPDRTLHALSDAANSGALEASR